jgi:alpha-galactosidase
MSPTAQEFPGQDEGLVTDPGIKANSADGMCDLVLKHRSHRLDEAALVIELADIRQPLAIALRYAIDPANGAITCSSAERCGSRPWRR